MEEQCCFEYKDECFADLQILRYRLSGFNELTIDQKKLVYFLSEATLWGRDITFMQFCKYNLVIRRLLESVYVNYEGNRNSDDFRALTVYLKRIWFSNGIHHHYGCEKFRPDFTEQFLRDAVNSLQTDTLESYGLCHIDKICDEVFPVIFNPDILSKHVNKTDGDDLIVTSACNFYNGVSQKDVEDFYATQKRHDDVKPVSHGLNSTLVKDEKGIYEKQWRIGGLYGNYLEHVVYWLEKAMTVAENDKQRNAIRLLVDFYQTGDLETFDQYSIEWVRALEGQVDFINGFIEVYGDPLGIKGSWEGLVEYKDLEASKRTSAISRNAQWFEDHSPVNPKFRKSVVKGVIANAVCAAMLGGDEYPSTAIGINLPNADWIRAQYGSKSVTISNITDAYNKASHGNGFLKEFVVDNATMVMIDKYGDICDNLHTDLHECLGHGSGQLLQGVDPDALKSYGNTIEEARADLFGLYYIADDKLCELGLLPDKKAYQAQYYTYIMNGLLTQMIRIQPGNNIEEAHMRNRALIARWAYDMGRKDDGDIINLEKINNKTYVIINNYEALRGIFAQQLAEVQRIKSEGDFAAARKLVERYAVKIDAELHQEILGRYKKLNLAPYKGFINPVLVPVYDDKGEFVDVQVDYSESYEHQMLRYGHDYSIIN